MKLVNCFSMKVNYQDLTHIPSTNYYPGIYAAKVLSMCLIIYAHRMLYVLGSPLVDAETVEVVSSINNLILVFLVPVNTAFYFNEFRIVLL